MVDQALSMRDDDDAEDEGNSVEKVKRGSAGVGDLFREDSEKSSIVLPEGGVVHSLVHSPRRPITFVYFDGRPITFVHFPLVRKRRLSETYNTRIMTDTGGERRLLRQNGFKEAAAD